MPREFKSRRTAKILYVMGMSLYAVGLVLAMNGCFGYVEGDGGAVEVAEPDVYVFGGYGDGWHARDYARRGGESRGFHGGGRTTVVPAGHAGGGGRR